MHGLVHHEMKQLLRTLYSLLHFKAWGVQMILGKEEENNNNTTHPLQSALELKAKKDNQQSFSRLHQQSFSGLHTLKKDYREPFSGLLNPPSLSHGASASLLYNNNMSINTRQVKQESNKTGMNIRYLISIIMILDWF